MLKQITQEETNRRYIRERTSDRETRCLRCYYCCKIFEADDKQMIMTGTAVRDAAGNSLKWDF